MVSVFCYFINSSSYKNTT